MPNDSLVTGILCRDATPSAWQEARALQKFAVELKKSSTRGAKTAPGQHAVGVWNILWHNADVAIAELRAAAALEPANASIQSDLAVAFLQRAQLLQDPVSVLQAFTANDSALKLDPRLEEALFNKALLLELLHLGDLAARQWQAYIAAHGGSPWADEARGRLETLREERPDWGATRQLLGKALAAGDSTVVGDIARRFPWRVRERVRAELIAWAEAYTDDPSSADAIARRALMIARALRPATTDAMWEDIAGAIDSATRTGDRPRLVETARGFLAYDRALAAFERLSLDSATVWLERAAEAFSHARNPAVHLMEYDLARVSYQRHTSVAYADALARFRRVASSASPTYRWLRGIATRNVGFIEFIGAEFDAASASFSAAIDEGAVVRDPVLELRTRTDAARLLAMLRGEGAGWEMLYGAFGAAARYPETPGEGQRLFATAAALSVRRAPDVALLFQRESVRLAASLGDSLLMVSALTRQAELLARVGRRAEALESLRQVSAYATGIKRDSTRAVMLADAELVNGQVWLRERPDSAMRVLRGVVERYEADQYLVQVGRANLLLAAAYIAADVVDSARGAFDDALATMEHARAGIASFDDRMRFLDEARPVIDTVTRFLASQRDTVEALEFLERMRGRVLLERGSRVPNASTYRSVSAVRRTLDDRTSILSYAVLDGELIGWLLRRDGVWMRRLATGDSLQYLVGRFAQLIEARSDGGEIASVGARLREMLIVPFESNLPLGSKLVVVPDKWLHFVPFAALFDPRRRQFLVQGFEVSVAPSVQLFVEASERYAKRDDGTAVSMLAVGNPAFDRDAYNLPMLPGAEREAREAASRYPSVRLLVGPGATRSEFLAQARGAKIIHFAGHGIVSPDAPLLSQLVLAPDRGPGSSGALYARDLFSMSLPVTRLAILSGCRTAAGELSGTEGVSSLARALFAAGVPAVIASLWAVDDRGADAFFSRYHDDLSRFDDPGAALRRTQVEWIERGDAWRTASTWAAFQLFGATGSRSERAAPARKTSDAAVQSIRKVEAPTRRLGR